ncbi:hypothetical protein HPB50_023674 [Hyalomma asiaticum]|uniref:Uncharacterized protein n=1 Tax=Hyalomma asiaticum TaxID=266040 RepID=A0ACB7T6V5_HYAAI|nr:hypothetical protein HPB50_023674 [Hyalomma asiaticum]
MSATREDYTATLCQKDRERTDIHEFLVRRTSFITREQLKSRKALEGHNFVTSGWVREPWVTKAAAYTVIVVTQLSDYAGSACKRAFVVFAFSVGVRCSLAYSPPLVTVDDCIQPMHGASADLVLHPGLIRCFKTGKKSLQGLPNLVVIYPGEFN